MTTRMQQRRGTSTQWTAANPTLAAGEIGHETNTGKSKIGDGQTAWNSLVYYTTSADLTSASNTLTLGAASILSTHNSTTTNVHGISDTSSLAYLSQVNAAISTAATDATTKANAAQAAAATDATTKANAAQAAAATDATTKVAAVTKASLGLGVVDNVEDASKPVSTAQAAAIAAAKAEAIAAASTAADTKISTHDTDTTNIHGIADTSVLATATTVATAKSEAITAAGTAADTKVSTAVAALTKSSVGLANVDNTADASKPVSTAQASAIATAKSEAIAEVNALLVGAPAALNTLDELAAALGDDANFASTVTTNLAAKAPLASPTFTGTVTVAAAGVAFTDGTQTKAGVPSITNIPTALAAGARTIEASRSDQFIPLTGAVEITLPATGYSTGQSIDFFQESGTGALFASTNSVVGTPGLKFRTTYSVATAMKTSSGWLVFGDLSA